MNRRSAAFLAALLITALTGNDGGSGSAAAPAGEPVNIASTQSFDPSPGDGEEHVFEVAVVGGGEDEGSAGFEQVVAAAEEAAGVVDVLDDLGGDDHIDLADGGEEVGVEGLAVGEEEVDVGEGLACDLDAGGGEIGAVELPFAVAELGDEGAVAATDVHHERAWRHVFEEVRDVRVEIFVTGRVIRFTVVVGDATHRVMITVDASSLILGRGSVGATIWSASAAAELTQQCGSGELRA